MQIANALRSLFIWTAIAVITVCYYPFGLALFLLTLPFDRQRRFGHAFATHWARTLLKLNNRWTTEVIGTERIPRDRPLVVVSNHQGIGDIMMAFCLDLHFKWISKAANFYVPFMGWFMYHAGYIPLRRGRKSSIVECMARSRHYLDHGVSVLFFPEGTRSLDGQIKPFKAGAFRLAIEGGYDILPLAINGTRDALPKHTWRFSDTHAAMKVMVGEVISTAGLKESDLEALVRRTRDVVIRLHEELEGRTARVPRLLQATAVAKRPAAPSSPPRAAAGGP